jgi:long-chain acyl-CoA synthetase
MAPDPSDGRRLRKATQPLRQLGRAITEPLQGEPRQVRNDVKGALAEYLEAALAGASAPVEGADGSVSPERLLAEARSIAAKLSAMKIAPAEPVISVTSNRPGDIAAMLGIWLAGGVVVPLHAEAAAGTAKGVQEAIGARLRVAAGRVEAISGSPPPPRELLRPAAFIIFTSGSTGKPKGVVIGHDRLAGKLAVLDRLLGLGPHDKVILPLQLTFIFGIWVALLALYRGARLALLPRFTLETVAHAFGDGGSILAAVPSMLRAVTGGPRVEAPALRTILCGGESLPAPLVDSMGRMLPQARLYDLYGLTETGSCDFCLPPDGRPTGAGSIGRPTEGVDFRVLTVDGSPAHDGVSGELSIRTPYGMLGYLDAPDLTAHSFSEGYFKTGDLARLRADGRVEIVGRLKDIISRGGNKIAPAEIDAVLAAHPGVAAVLTAGIPDARFGEAICAIVVPKAGAAVTAEALRHWAAERIERYKVPDRIHFRDALPVGPTGKLLRSGVARLVSEAEGKLPE